MLQTNKQTICPKVKLLAALKILAFGVYPSAFQDYFQMSLTMMATLVKILTKIIVFNSYLQDTFMCTMTHIDAKNVSNLYH